MGEIHEDAGEKDAEGHGSLRVSTRIGAFERGFSREPEVGVVAYASLALTFSKLDFPTLSRLSLLVFPDVMLELSDPTLFTLLNPKLFDSSSFTMLIRPDQTLSSSPHLSCLILLPDLLRTQLSGTSMSDCLGFISAGDHSS